LKPMSLSHANISTHQRQSFMKHRGDSHSISTAPTDHDNDHHSYTSSELKSFKNIASEDPSDRYVQTVICEVDNADTY